MTTKDMPESTDGKTNSVDSDMITCLQHLNRVYNFCSDINVQLFTVKMVSRIKEEGRQT